MLNLSKWHIEQNVLAKHILLKSDIPRFESSKEHNLGTYDCATTI